MFELEKVVCPVMSVDDKYRTLYAALMGVFKEIAEYAGKNLSNKNLQDLVNAALHGAGVSAGIRLVKVYQLKPTIEDALKLLILFHNEALAYLPKMKQIYGELEKKEGKLVVKNDPWYEWYFKHLPINCEEGCSCYGFPGLLSVLGEDFKIETIKSKPRGDDICSFRITER